MSMAHRDPLAGRTHDLEVHLKATAQRARSFAAPWGGGDMAYLAGLWHDLGKYAADFQEMLADVDAEGHLESSGTAPRPRVNHSSAGAIWATECGRRDGENELGKVLAYVIAGHHAGLPDFESTDGGGTLAMRLAERHHLDRALRAPVPAPIRDAALPKLRWAAGRDLSLWIRMIASALFDADFLDTERFFAPADDSPRDQWSDISQLAPRFHEFVRRFERSTGPVNDIRRIVLDACLVRAALPPGLFSLTVPTGGGKTIASLGFALRHAKRFGKRRVIYAAPFTSIIEQTAGVYREILGDDAVLEHHSALDPDGQSTESRLAAENWNAPIVVTTSVQLFESLFAARTSAVRKLHNIADSVLILDEAQALPPAVLRPVTVVLGQLAKHYGVTVVLCTATQPALASVYPDLAEIREIIGAPDQLFTALKRTQTEWLDDVLEPADLASRLAADDRVLAIVNTRRMARRIHDLLPPGAVHLSTWQCPAHRRRILATIRSPEKSVRVVSTSLVEAGVDIDFPVVYREVTGLDSLAQAAGRCNREGRLAAPGRFVAFRLRGETLRGHVLQAAQAAAAVRRRNQGDSFSPEAFRSYFEELYWLKGPEALDKYEMGRLLNLGDKRIRFDLAFRTAADKFRMIDDAQRTVIIPFEREGAQLIDALRASGPNRFLLRRLQRFTVTLSPWDFAALERAHVTETIDGLTTLVVPTLYREDVGLDVPALGTPPLDTLIA